MANFRGFETVQEAAERAGCHPESLKRRIRALRKKGEVEDLGDIPKIYGETPPGEEGAAVSVLWLHPKLYLIQSGYDSGLFTGQKKQEDSQNAEA